MALKKTLNQKQRFKFSHKGWPRGLVNWGYRIDIKCTLENLQRYS